ncbi:hypothetical protein [Agromyces sp. Marseille-P2726]|uniref:hypothetical protein n=1 Tax=Agromyces sp. Marseille-P2726 TaxID=2709132 RepID=UPI00156D66A7|nr:hypothetical protein [Agromyces sp. Marseille-P2726]
MAFRYEEQMQPPEPRRVTDVAITTHEHVFEVDPRLMERWVLQQTFPNWDSLRIMNARGDHLAWMHAHFAKSVVTGSDLLAEVDAEATARSAQAGSAAASVNEAPETPT